jgi:acetyl esterase
MPVDPQTRAILDFHATLPHMHTLSVAELRTRLKAPPPPGLKVAEVASAADRTVSGPGGPLGLRVYTPPGAGPFPLLVFFHGGGFVLCDLDTHDPVCRNLCAGAGCVVVSVDYRLAPEHRFPAAPDDCLAAARWAAEHAAELGADPARIAVAGDSAGGALAAVTALRVRDEGGPRLAGQLLIYPVTDLEMPARPSFVENGEGYGLTGEDMAWFRGHYLNDPSEARHPHASPMHAPDLRGLPPALVVTAEYDPLRDEAEDYAARLRDAGVTTAACRYDGVIHGFFSLAGLVDKGGAALEETCAWLRSVLAAVEQG